jgi:hypothetical protein
VQNGISKGLNAHGFVMYDIWFSGGLAVMKQGQNNFQAILRYG